MAAIGYAVSCEEHGPRDLVRYARLAEEAGFPFALPRLGAKAGAAAR